MPSVPPRTRPPERIDVVLAALRDVWVNDPDLRLTQLIVNAANMAGREVVAPELFSLEDEQLLLGLNRCSGIPHS